MPRHRHAEPYVAVVLAGGFVEAGDGGRWRARPGSVIVHGAHEAHADAFDVTTTRVLNLPCVGDLAAGAGAIDDADAVARLAERDPHGAAALVAATLRADRAALDDWPDLLAAALLRDPGLAIGDWADGIGLARASVSRGFQRAYDVTPKRYRLETRARRAFARVIGSAAPLAEIAAELDFADQAHMTRSLVALTGATPGALRAKSVQAGAAAAR